MSSKVKMPEIYRNDFYRMDDSVLNDAFDRVLTKLHIQKREYGKSVFMVCGSQPGAGSTMVAINLAITTSLSNWKTLFIDADLRKKPEYKRIIGNGNKQLGDYLTGSADSDDMLLETSYPNLSYIAGSNTKENPVILLCSDRLPILIDSLKNRFDFIIIDAPSPLAAPDASLIGSLVDGVILVAKWNSTKTSQIQQTIKELQDSDSKIMGIIANQVDAESFKRINRNHSYFINQDYLANYRKGRRKRK